jgi:uncharacterized membrane protein YjgN (DUF898 family)
MQASQNALRSADDAAPPPAPQTLSGRWNVKIEFHATGGEYFRIWIVNLLATLLTLGIYSPWAKVRRLRYFYGSTSIDGSTFEYHGQPVQILKGRLIAAGAGAAAYATWTFSPTLSLALIPVMLAMLPWVVVRSRRFHSRMTEYRGVRFGFNGTYRGAFGPYVGWLLIASIIGFLTPSWNHRRVAFLLGNTAYGAEEFTFTKGDGAWYRFYYAAVGMAIASFVAAVLLFDGAQSAYTSISAGEIADVSANPAAALAALVLLIGFAPLGILAYYRSRAVNSAFDELQLGAHKIWCDLRTGPLLRIYLANLAALIVTLGLYYPWARVRLVRYQLESMTLNLTRPLDDFVSDASEAGTATGDEIGDFFAIDFGL